MPVYTYTTLDDPSATTSTRASGINASGQIVGGYTGMAGTGHSGGIYTTIDDPSATIAFGTGAGGINAAGQIVGTYQDGAGFHGFLASPDGHGGYSYPTSTIPQAPRAPLDRASTARA
jgi:hypothetical protein